VAAVFPDLKNSFPPENPERRTVFVSGPHPDANDTSNMSAKNAGLSMVYPFAMPISP